MEVWQSIVLAFIQGITEFLPVSSSAHLILVPIITQWQDQGLAFDVAVHFGTLIAVLHYFRQQIRQLIVAWFGNFTDLTNQDVRISWSIIISTLPVVIVGALFNDWIEAQLRSPEVIAWSTIVFGVLLAVSTLGKKTRGLAEITLLTALIIGLFQVVALIPGTSRSGITITAALFLGWRMTDAARYSFLLSIPVILGATLLQFLKLMESPIATHWFDMGVAVLVAAVSAWFCMDFFLRIVERIGMMPFVLYRLLLGGGLLFYFGM